MSTLDLNSPDALQAVSDALRAALIAESIEFSQGFRDDLVRHMFRILGADQ